MLEDKSWENVLLKRDQDSAFNNLFESIDNCFECSFPEKNVNHSRKNRPFNPWMSKALIISRKHKAKLFNKKLRKYTHKLLPASFENIFKKLGTFERSLDILKMCSLQYLPSSSLLQMWNNLPLELKRSNSLSIFKNLRCGITCLLT